MAGSRRPSDPKDQGIYNTPKEYDYIKAVQGTAPLPSGNAGDPRGGTDYPPQFVEPRKKMARGKGIRGNATRGRPARKKDAGKSDTTRKDAAETHRSGQENNRARGSNNPVPNPNPNLDNYIDPSLRYIGRREYQQDPYGELHQGAAPKGDDGAGSPQGYDLEKPQDIAGGNRRLDNPNHDEFGSIGDLSNSNSEDEDNDQDRDRFNTNPDNLEKEEKPFEGPMMTKKVILQRARGATTGWDQDLRYRESKGNWVPAVYHESIRLDLINKAKLTGKYDHERAAGIAPEDITSYLESQRGWGPERDGTNEDGSYRKGNWPDILYQIQKPGDYTVLNKDKYPKADDWVYHGRVVLSVQDGLPLTKYDTLPDTLSSKITGAEMEAMLRLNPRVQARDLIGRMPMYYLSDDGNRLLLYSCSTISMRTSRFRREQALMGWRTRGGTDNTNEMVRAYLEQRAPWAIQQGSTQRVGPPPKKVVDALLESNKNNPAVTNRAGLFAVRPQQAPPAVAPPQRLDQIGGISDSEAGNPQPSPVLSPRSIVQRRHRNDPPAPNNRPLKRDPTTMQTRSTRSAQPPEQHPPEQSGPPRPRPRTRNPEPAARQQPTRQSPPASRPPTRGRGNDAATGIQQPPQEEDPGQPPVLSIPPPRDRARTKFVPPRTRIVGRDNRSRSPARNDERRAGREREPPAPNPTTRQTRAQATTAEQASAQQQERPPPASRPPARGPRRNPPTTVPQPQQQQQQGGNRPAPTRTRPPRPSRL